MMRSGGVACTADATTCSACSLIFWYCPVPTRESTSFSRLASSSWGQSCTIDQTRKALILRSCSVGGAFSTSFFFASHQAFAAAALPSFVFGHLSCRHETAYILPMYFLNHRRVAACQVIWSL